MNKYQFFDNLVQQVRDIDISEVMSNYIELKNKGRHKLGLCPFHNDKKLGSFVVTPFKGMWFCFTCGIGGDSIKFVSDFKRISYVEATFEIALRYHIIGQEEYNEYFLNKRYNSKKRDLIIKKYDDENKKRIKEMEGEKANSKDLDRVYRIFINNSKLIKNHHKHLKIEKKPVVKDSRNSYKQLEAQVLKNVILDDHNGLVNLNNLPHIMLMPDLNTGNVIAKLDFFIKDIVRVSCSYTSMGPVLLPSRADIAEGIMREFIFGVALVAQHRRLSND
jgi:hypothetical protein